MKFRKKPVVIDALQWDGSLASFNAIHEFTGKQRTAQTVGANNPQPGVITIETLEGVMTANKGDWIIKGIKGEFYPCKPDIFESTYEAV